MLSYILLIVALILAKLFWIAALPWWLIAIPVAYVFGYFLLYCFFWYCAWKLME